MELREKIARTIHQTASYEMNTCEYIADAILNLPEIRDALELSSRCYLHDGPGGVSVQLRTDTAA